MLHDVSFAPPLLTFATMDLAATFIDHASGELADGMTSTPLRPVLEGHQQTVRDYVSSGLNEYEWRMVVKKSERDVVQVHLWQSKRSNIRPSLQLKLGRMAGNGYCMQLRTIRLACMTSVYVTFTTHTCPSLIRMGNYEY